MEQNKMIKNYFSYYGSQCGGNKQINLPNIFLWVYKDLEQLESEGFLGEVSL